MPGQSIALMDQDLCLQLTFCRHQLDTPSNMFDISSFLG